MSVTVKAGSFQGPFELLLELVRQDRIAADSLSVADLADQYLERMGTVEIRDLEVAGDFLYVAACLSYLKAAYLVKADFDEEDEYGTLEDVSDDLTPTELRQELMEKLLTYHEISGSAAWLSGREQAASSCHPPAERSWQEFAQARPNYLVGISLRTLSVLCADCFSRVKPKILDAPHVSKKRISIAELAQNLERLLQEGKIKRFSQLLENHDDPEALVGNFLALLELCKLGLVRVRQKTPFADISLAPVPGTPGPGANPVDLDEYDD